MITEPHPQPRAAHEAASLPASRRAHWTPAKQRIFLVVLHDTGCVATAARTAGMSRSSAHRLRARLAGTPFDRAWTQAVRERQRRLADPLAPDRLTGGRPDAAPATRG